MYLYILVFSDLPFFKLGISKSSIYRTKVHINKYSFNLHESFIVEAKDSRIIPLLEREILCCFPEEFKVQKFQRNFDGYTEFRSLKYLEETLSIINGKHENFGIKIHRFYDFLYKTKTKGTVADNVFIIYPINIFQEDFDFLIKFRDYLTVNLHQQISLTDVISEGLKLISTKYSFDRNMPVIQLKKGKRVFNKETKKSSARLLQKDIDFINDFVYFKTYEENNSNYSKTDFFHELRIVLQENYSKAI